MQFSFYLLSLQTEGCDINSIDETYDTEIIMQRIAGYGGTCLPYKGL
jgi:hypothetical protein